jgi:hypothetical protein
MMRRIGVAGDVSAWDVWAAGVVWAAGGGWVVGRRSG